MQQKKQKGVSVLRRSQFYIQINDINCNWSNDILYRKKVKAFRAVAWLRQTTMILYTIFLEIMHKILIIFRRKLVINPGFGEAETRGLCALLKKMQNAP